MMQPWSYLAGGAVFTPAGGLSGILKAAPGVQLPPSARVDFFMLINHQTE